MFEMWPGPDDHPDAKSEETDNHHQRYKYRSYPVSQMLDWGLATLSLCDQADDLGEHSLTSGMVHSDHKAAGGVHRSGRNL